MVVLTQVALPKEGAEETRTRWTEGWGSADLTVDVTESASDSTGQHLCCFASDLYVRLL